MIQFNLLPDIKLETIRANKLKRAVTIISSIVAASCLIIMLILYLSIDVAQKSQVSKQSTEIVSKTNQLKNTPNLNAILKLQGQVNSLPALHTVKPVASRLPGFIAQLTPIQVTISSLEIDYTKNTLQISGSADSLATVNTYVDTFKFSKYQTSSTSVAKNAFPSVVLSAFSYATKTGATYTISITFDPAIFSSLYNNPTLNVPTQITTRSQLDQPNVLFQPQPTTTTSSSSSNSSNSSNNTTQ